MAFQSNELAKAYWRENMNALDRKYDVHED
jgi:hypothetical protein